MGASEIVTTASAPKHALLKQLGATQVLDYKTGHKISFLERLCNQAVLIKLSCICIIK
jgi:NADPH:quinone reductase-like Zn-dependent oxidoreductase